MSISTFEYVKDALKYKASGNYALAETALQRALALDPNSISTLQELGLLKMDQGQFEEALKIFNDIIETRPLSSTLYRKALCLFKMDRITESFNVLTDLELQQFDFVGAWELRADIYRTYNQQKEAIECINTEIKHSPTNLSLLKKRADLYLDINKIDEALADLKKLCLSDYKNLESYIPYVELLIQQGHYIEANTFLKQSLLYGKHEKLEELSALVIEKLGISL